MKTYKVLVPHNGRKGWVDLEDHPSIQALIRAGYLKEVTDGETTVPDPGPDEPRMAPVPARPVKARRKTAQDVPEVTDVDVEAEPDQHPQDGQG